MKIIHNVTSFTDAAVQRAANADLQGRTSGFWAMRVRHRSPSVPECIWEQVQTPEQAFDGKEQAVVQLP